MTSRYHPNPEHRRLRLLDKLGAWIRLTENPVHGVTRAQAMRNAARIRRTLRELHRSVNSSQRGSALLEPDREEAITGRAHSPSQSEGNSQ